MCYMHYHNGMHAIILVRYVFKYKIGIQVQDRYIKWRDVKSGMYYPWHISIEFGERLDQFQILGIGYWLYRKLHRKQKYWVLVAPQANFFLEYSRYIL